MRNKIKCSLFLVLLAAGAAFFRRSGRAKRNPTRMILDRISMSKSTPNTRLVFGGFRKLYPTDSYYNFRYDRRFYPCLD